MAGPNVAKGSECYGGVKTAWKCKVTGFGKGNTVGITWLTGPLKGRPARVPKETLSRTKGDAGKH